MTATVTINDAKLRELLTSERGPVGKMLNQAALRVERRAKRLAPVDTGRLRSSISHRLERRPEGLVAVVGTDVDYGVYQELGTERMDAHPFLRPALMAASIEGAASIRSAEADARAARVADRVQRAAVRAARRAARGLPETTARDYLGGVRDDDEGPL